MYLLCENDPSDTPPKIEMRIRWLNRQKSGKIPVDKPEVIQ